MKTLIEIIKPYFDSVFGEDFSKPMSGRLAAEIESSGLMRQYVIEYEKAPDELRDKITQHEILKSKNKGQFSDGYHTFNDLYEIRKAYNVALFNEWGSQLEVIGDPVDQNVIGKILPKHDVHKSWRHHDGELCFGGEWFIVVAVLPSGQISNHYEAKDWDLFRVPETETAKYEWDGHTTKDVINRLING